MAVPPPSEYVTFCPVINRCCPIESVSLATDTTSELDASKVKVNVEISSRTLKVFVESPTTG